MEGNEIYKFMKDNNLTSKTEDEFVTEYSDPAKAKELHGFMQENNLTTKNDTEFYDQYFGKKKAQTVPAATGSETGGTVGVSNPSSTGNIEQPSVADIPQFEKPQTLYPEAPTATTTFNPNQKYRDTLLDTTLHTFQSNPIFQEPKNRQIYYNRLAGKNIPPAILDQVIHEGENAYLSPAQKLGKSVAAVGTNTIEAPGQMGEAGLKNIKDVPKAFDEYNDGSVTGLYKGFGNAALQAVKGVGEAAMGAASVTPPGVAFNAIANTASEVAPEVTHAIMAPVTSAVNKAFDQLPFPVKKPRWLTNSAAIADFATFALGLKAAHEGGAALKEKASYALDGAKIRSALNDLDPEAVKAYSDKLEQQYGEKKNVYEIPEKESVDLDNNISSVAQDLQNNPDLAEILQPKLQKLTEDNDALQSSIAATAVQDAHIEAVKDAVNDGIAQLEVKKEGLSPAGKEAVDETINTLKKTVSNDEPVPLSKEPIEPISNTEPLNTEQNVQEPTRSSASDAPGTLEKEITTEPKEIAPEPVSEGAGSEAEADLNALEKEYNAKSVDELVALKKELYPNPDIESAMSPKEKLLNEVTAKKFSDKNAEIKARRDAKQAPKEEPVLEGRQDVINKIVSMADAYNSMQKGRLGRGKSEGAKALNDAMVAAKEAGFDAEVVGKQRTLVIRNKNGNKIRAKYEDNSNKGEAKDYTPLSERSPETQDAFKQLNEYGLNSFPTIRGADGKRMSVAQMRNAIADILSDVPSNGAKALLDAVDSQMQDGHFEIDHPEVGKARIPAKDYLESLREENAREIDMSDAEETALAKEHDEINPLDYDNKRESKGDAAPQPQKETDTAGKRKAEREYNESLTAAKESLADAEKQRQTKLNSLNKKVDLFEGTGKQEGQLVDVAQDQSPEAIKAALKTYDDKISTAKKKVEELESNKDKELAKYDNQRDLTDEIAEVEKPKDDVGKTVSIIHAGMKRSGEITEVKDGHIYVKDKAGTTYSVKPSDIMKEGESFEDAINRINKKRRHEVEPEPYQKKISDIKGNRKALLDQLKKDTSGQLNAGIDPSHIPTLIKIGKTYLEEGVVHFEHFARKLYEDLKGLRIRFNRNDPEFQKDVAHIYNESKKQRFENISPDVALSVQRKAADLSEAKIKQAKRKTWDKFYKGFVRHIEDIAGNVKEALRNAGGEDAVMMKDIANKSNGKASLKIEELNKKIFHGLKEPELKDLGNIIQAKRTIQLDEMYDARKQPRLNHELGHTKEFYEAVLDGMEKENPEQFKKLSDKADDYFKAMQDLLKEKKENGLIDKAAYEVLKEQSMYSPRAFIQHMDQIENGFNNKNAVSNNGIKKLDEGSEGLLDKDPQFLLANAVSRAYSLMAKNDAAKTLLDFAENNPDNGVVEPRKISGNTLNDKVAKEVNKFEEQKGVTLTPAQIDAIRQKIIDADYDKKVEEFADKYNKQPTQLQKDILKEQAEKGENTYAPVPSGEEVISAFVDGHKRDMLMDKEQAAEWMGTDPAISAALGEATQWLTGANLLRYTATGINPAFALANAPRDMAYIYLTTDGTYSKHLPVFVKQIHQDMATVASDAIKRTGRYKEFINEGGSIELLTHQGRFNLTKGINEGVNKISHALGYIGETSELMTRLAMRERGIKNGTKEFEKQNGRPPTPDELNKIKVKATYDAVNQLDFSQGGDWSKALNKFVPYLNAAMQANRGLFREMKTNPKAFAYKAAQLATVAGGLTVYNLSQPGYDQISDDEKARYYILMLGGLYSTDANGNKNYRYLKLAKSQETQFITAVAENAVEFSMTGKSRPKEMMHGLKNQMPPIPFLTQDVPMAEMLRTYESNYDRFYDRKLWHGQEGLSPELEFNPAGKYKTPEIYRKLGETTGLSPERVRGSLPKLLVGTERNPLMTIPGKAFQVAAEGMGITERDALNKTLTQSLDDMFKGTYSKFYGETNPMRKTGYDEEVLTTETNAKKKMNDDVKAFIDKNLGKDVDKDKAVAEFREFVDKKYKDAESKERERMVNSFRTGLQDSKLDYWYVKLSNYSTDSRAKIFKNRYDSTSESEREEMRKIMKDNIDINTPAFRNKLKAMGFKDDLEPEKK
jgi:hypothetical protein